MFSIGGAAQIKLKRLLIILKQLTSDKIISGEIHTIHFGLRHENVANSEYDHQDFHNYSTAMPLQVLLSKSFEGGVIIFAGGREGSIAISNTAMTGTYPIYKSDPTHTFNLVVNKITVPVSYPRSNSTSFLTPGAGNSFQRAGLSGEFN
jgi:hypothetical protein